MPARRARERFFRGVLLPDHLGMDPATVARIPMSYLLEMYGSIYHLGRRGPLVERQMTALLHGLRALSTHYFGMALDEYEAAFWDLHREVQKIRRRRNLSARQKDLIYPDNRRAPYAEVPHVHGYLEYVAKQRQTPLDDINHGFYASFVVFVAISANLDRLAREPETAEVVAVYEAFCAKWGIPLTLDQVAPVVVN